MRFLLSFTLLTGALLPLAGCSTLRYVAQAAAGQWELAAAARPIPEVLEAHTITGSGDLLVRVVARDNPDLQRVIDQVVDDRHVIRASTVISLATRIDHRTLPLVAEAASGS